MAAAFFGSCAPVMASGGAAAAAAAAAAASSPVSGGVFTAAQSQAGAGVYAQQCAACHGPALEGGAGPPLKGSVFQQMAAAQALTGETLLSVVTQTMPQSSPASLPPAQYAAVVAYLLEQNGYPPGSTEVVPGNSDLKALQLGH